MELICGRQTSKVIVSDEPDKGGRSWKSQRSVLGLGTLETVWIKCHRVAVGKLEEEWKAVRDGKIKELSWSTLNERRPSVTNSGPVMKVAGLLEWRSLDVGVIAIEVFYRYIHKNALMLHRDHLIKGS